MGEIKSETSSGGLKRLTCWLHGCLEETLFFLLFVLLFPVIVWVSVVSLGNANEGGWQLLKLGGITQGGRGGSGRCIKMGRVVTVDCHVFDQHRQEEDVGQS